jgi:hypothetical protein
LNMPMQYFTKLLIFLPPDFGCCTLMVTTYFLEMCASSWNVVTSFFRFSVFFFSILWCSHHTGNHPSEDLIIVCFELSESFCLDFNPFFFLFLFPCGVLFIYLFVCLFVCFIRFGNRIHRKLKVFFWILLLFTYL